MTMAKLRKSHKTFLITYWRDRMKFDNIDRVVGKFVLASAGEATITDGTKVQLTMLGGIVADNLVTCKSWEAWEGEIILIPSAKYRGGVKGHTISSLLCSGFLNDPQNHWEEKYF